MENESGTRPASGPSQSAEELPSLTDVPLATQQLVDEINDVLRGSPALAAILIEERSLRLATTEGGASSPSAMTVEPVTPSRPAWSEALALALAAQPSVLELILGSEAAAGFRANRDRADEITRTWSSLIALRRSKSDELVKLADDVATIDDSLAQPMNAVLRSMCEETRENRVQDVRRIADALSDMDAEIAVAFKNQRRAATILSVYEFDGLGMETPNQWKGFARKRLSVELGKAYQATLPVVEAVFGEDNARVLRLSDIEAASELHRRLGGAKFGELQLEHCALAIYFVRTRIAPQGGSNVADARAHLLNHLRDPSFIEEWLKPRAGDDGRGTGPKSATIELLANATDLGVSCVRDMVAAATRGVRPFIKRTPRVRRKAYRGKPLRLLR